MSPQFYLCSRCGSKFPKADKCPKCGARIAMIRKRSTFPIIQILLVLLMFGGLIGFLMFMNR